MVRENRTFLCEFCGHEWATEAEAEACEALGEPPIEFPVGTSVRIRRAISPTEILATDVRRQSAGGTIIHQRRYEVLLYGQRRWFAAEAITAVG